jgi:hypothetical protein
MYEKSNLEIIGNGSLGLLTSHWKWHSHFHILMPESMSLDIVEIKSHIEH